MHWVKRPDTKWILLGRDIEKHAREHLRRFVIVGEIKQRDEQSNCDFETTLLKNTHCGETYRDVFTVTDRALESGRWFVLDTIVRQLIRNAERRSA